MLSNLLENGEKCIEKCNFHVKYFDKIKCYADRPYLVFLELKPETHIYFFFGLMLIISQNFAYLPNYSVSEVILMALAYSVNSER